MTLPQVVSSLGISEGYYVQAGTVFMGLVNRDEMNRKIEELQNSRFAELAKEPAILYQLGLLSLEPLYRENVESTTYWVRPGEYELWLIAGDTDFVWGLDMSVTEDNKPWFERIRAKGNREAYVNDLSLGVDQAFTVYLTDTLGDHGQYGVGISKIRVSYEEMAAVRFKMEKNLEYPERRYVSMDQFMKLHTGGWSKV